MQAVAKASATTPSQEELIQKLIAENARLQAELTKPKANGLGIKVSAKGAVSVYGMGRFPVTLYASQWLALLAKGDDITKFIEANKAQLKTKEA